MVGDVSMTSIEIKEIQLERVTIYTTERINSYLEPRIKRSELRLCEDQDAYEFRRIFRGFGKIDRKTITCPSTWWQHLKLALRRKWPRLFGRLAVRMDEVIVEAGAVVNGLNEKIGGRYYVIPYTMDPLRFSYTDDPKNKND